MTESRNQCPQIEMNRQKCGISYAMKYSSGIKTMPRVPFNNIMLSRSIQTQRDTYSMIPLDEILKNGQIHRKKVMWFLGTWEQEELEVTAHG